MTELHLRVGPGLSPLKLPAFVCVPQRFPMHDTAYPSAATFRGARLLSLGLLALPAAVLGIMAARHQSQLLLIGATAELLGALLFVRYKAVWRPPTSASVILVYIMSLAWLWFETKTASDAPTHAARGTLLITMIGLLVCHDMIRSGLEPRRKAQKHCRRLLARRDWPNDLAGYDELPEVRALRDAVRDDMGPVIRLFENDRPQIRIAALTAIRHRRLWRPGESAAVMRVARSAKDPAVRAAAIRAFGHNSDAVVIQALAPFLRDPSQDVRVAVIGCLLSGDDDRWPLTRDMVRDALSQTNTAADGALAGAAGRLPAMAVCDLTLWSNEAEPLASRSVRTLIEHYALLLRTQDIPELPAELGRQVVDPQTPSVLRIELAGLMRALGLLTPELLDRMTDSDQLGAIRLMAAEAILEHNPANEEAIDVLRGLGRQSNREMALEIARLVQMYLGLDMGLPHEPVAANSKIAMEATRRVLMWASARHNANTTTPIPLGAAPPATPIPRPVAPPRQKPGTPPKPPEPEKFKRSSTRFRWLPG